MKRNILLISVIILLIIIALPMPALAFGLGFGGTVVTSLTPSTCGMIFTIIPKGLFPPGPYVQTPVTIPHANYLIRSGVSILGKYSPFPLPCFIGVIPVPAFPVITFGVSF